MSTEPIQKAVRASEETAYPHADQERVAVEEALYDFLVGHGATPLDERECAVHDSWFHSEHGRHPGWVMGMLLGYRPDGVEP